jgi:hypothetical protein
MSCSSSDVQENFKFSLSYSVENTNLISSIDNIIILDTIEGSVEKPLIFKDDEIALMHLHPHTRDFSRELGCIFHVLYFEFHS